MPYTGPTTRDGIRENLRTRYNKQSMATEITLADEVIGRMVSYGKKDTLKVSKTGFRPTVFSGRVSFDDIRLSVEASSATSVLNALATQISREFRARKTTVRATSVAEEPSDVPVSALVHGPKF
jgi:hypothetical protein|nr:hypothetical protein [Neorhizobium tomejilense]